MDKLRGFLNPGKEKDDETLYGSGSQQDSSEPHSGNTGKLTGQGSHLSGVGADSSAPSTTQTVGSSGPTGADTTRPSDRTDNTSAASMKSGVLGNDPRTAPTVTGDNQSSVNTTGPASSGAGVAASKAWQSHDGRQGLEDNVPGAFPTDTNNPYKTSQLDPRVDSGNRASTTQSTSTPHQPATKTDYGGPRSTGNYGGGAGALPEHEKRDIQNTPGQSGHHTGRDAGLAAGGAALGAHEYEKHKDRDTSTTGNTYPSSTSNTTRQPTTSGTTGTNTGTSGYEPSSNQYSNTGATSQTQPNQGSSMYDRAAGGLAAGAAAVGLGSQAEKRDTRDNTGTYNTPGSRTAEETPAGHDTSARNTNRMATDTTGSRTAEHTPAGHDTSARNTNRMATDTTNDNQSNQGSGIAGKAAGVLAGGAAAVGLTKHEDNKHDEKKAEHDTRSGPGSNDYHTPDTMAGAPSDKTHGKDVSSTVHPSHGSARAPSFLGHLTGEESSSTVTGASDQTTGQESHHHAGRDAEGVAAGAGAAGIAEHEARKHHHPESSRDQSTGGPTEWNATGGQHPGLTGSTNQQTPTGAATQQGTHHHDDHRARDAALAGGAGAGLGGATYEAERHHHQPTDSRQAGQQLPIRDQTNQQYPGGATTQQGTTHHDHHHGRDAALAGGGLGGAAYEAERHRHEPRQPTQPVEPRAPVQPKEPAQTYYGAATTERDPSQVQAFNEPHRERHLGRDAAAGTAIGAGALGYEAEHGRHHHHGASTGTYDNQSYNPQSTGSQGTSRPYETGNTTAPGSRDNHHYGRDAAVGAGAAGLGGAAYEHHKKEEERGHPSQTQAYQQPAHDRHLGRDTVAGTAAGTGAGALASERPRHDAGQGYPQQSQQSEHQHHYGRDAAVGAGAAGLGGAAYEHHKNDEQRGYPSKTHQDQQYQQPEHDRHLGRDAAAGTAAGVGAGAAGHELSKKEAEKEQKAHEKELAKEQKHHDKELAKEHKADEKAYQKEIAKEHKAEEKAHQKAIAKDEKHREKEAAAAAAAEEKEKKPSLLDRILHRHKDDETTDETKGDHHRGEEAAAAGAVGAAGAGAYEYDQHHDRNALHDNNNTTQDIEHQKHGRNVLHKDPPAGYQDDANRVQYEDAPTKGYASQVTGGTGTTALAKGNELPSGSHLSGAGNVLDPAVHDRASTVTEPTTGLPMDLNKGTGVGGTDNGPQSGYRQ